MRRVAKIAGVVLALALVVTAFVALGGRSTLARDLDSWSYDVTVDTVALAPASRDVVFVDFDEETFHRIGLFPIPRRVIAQVVRQVGNAQPKVIGLDMFLSEERTPDDDKLMQQALTAAGVVVIAAQSPVGQLPAVMPLPVFCQPDAPPPYPPSAYCKDGTPGAVAYAAVNMPIAPDGFVRDGILAINAAGQTAVSFPVFLVQQATGSALEVHGKTATLNGARIPIDDFDEHTFLIGAWSRQPAMQIPAWKLLAGQIGPEALRGKVVLIGQSNDAARDSHLTPLFRAGEPDGTRLRMAGTQVHAAAVCSLLEGRTMYRTPPAVVWLIVFGASLLASFLAVRAPLNAGVLAIAALMGLAIGVSALLLHARHIWLPFLPVQVACALPLPLGLAVQFIHERVLFRKEQVNRKQLMQLFSRHVDPQVADRIWSHRDELSLAGEERMATVVFTDIRGFTALSRDKPPGVVLGWLNAYLTEMDDVIRRHGGLLNKFIGDGLMILFGVPLTMGEKEDACRSVRCALEMLEKLDELNRRHDHDPDFPCIRIGAGIHTGMLVAGSIGSAQRQEYSVIGATVNLASRLESLNKQFHSHILMSAVTAELVRDVFPQLEARGAAKVAGIDDPVEVFTIGPPLEDDAIRASAASAKVLQLEGAVPHA